MNLTPLVLLLSMVSAPQGEAAGTKSTPSEILTKMFARYASANSISGTIAMTQSANGASIHTNTELQFDRPSQLYLRQVRDGSTARQWLVTSDGTEWTYDRPESQSGAFGKPRYREYVTQHGYRMTMSDFLTGASSSLGDVNAMLISAMSSKEWMKRLTGQWASLQYDGKSTLDGQSVLKISGQYRENPSLAPSGTFEIYVSEAGDFLRYATRQRMQFPKISQDPIEIVTVWNSTLKIGAVTDPKLYRVVIAN